MEQLNVLHEILAADQAAQERVRGARQAQIALDGEVERLRAELDGEAADRARQTVEKSREEELSRVQQELEQLRLDHEGDLAALEARYLAGREEWTEKLFRMVVCLDDR